MKAVWLTQDGNTVVIISISTAFRRERVGRGQEQEAKPKAREEQLETLGRDTWKVGAEPLDPTCTSVLGPLSKRA